MRKKLAMLSAPFALLPVIAWVTPTLASAQDSKSGATAFNRTCQACHTPPPGQPNLLGPSLKGVFGRKAGTEAFDYSDPLKKSGIVWTDATLDKFLAAPTQVVAGTRMVIPVTDPKQRADIIAYLRTLK
jgi:cytochrome c